jgi:RND superfamily putative drug exporter
MAEFLYRIGKAAARRAGAVIGAWAAVLALTVAAFLTWGGSLATSFDIPGLPSSDVVAELTGELPDLAGASGTVVFSSENGRALTEGQQAEISRLIDSAADLPDVASVVDPFETEARRAEQASRLGDAQDRLEAGRAELATGQQRLDAGREQLEAALEQAEAAGAPAPQISALTDQRAALDAQQEAIDDGVAQLEAGEQQTADGAELLGYAENIRLVSEDSSTAQVTVAFDVPRLELQDAAKQAVIDHFTGTGIDGVEVSVSADISQAVPSLVGPGEVAGLAVAAIVLLVMLGSVLAAGIPIVTALMGVGIGAVGALSFSGVVQMASITPVLGLMLGLAVGIDYSLFILNRHRQQVMHGMDVQESIGLANGTSGTAVVFAGATVVVALLALNVTGIPFLGLMGTVGAACVSIAVLIALTLAPALVGLLGDRVATPKARSRARDQDDAMSRTRPMGTPRAVATVVLTAAVLLVLAGPAMHLRLGLPDGGTEPPGSSAQVAFTTLSEEFGAGSNATLLVAANLPEGLDETGRTAAQLTVARELAALDDVTAVAPIAVSDDGRIAAFQVVPTGGPNDESTEALVRQLRDLPAVDGDITLGVAGQAAINIDISESLRDVLPLYLLVVVGLSLIILVLVFRSILVPVIATGGFVLSLLATYGAITAVFQHGLGASLIGLHATGPILSFLPIILVGILFGLAMDYQLFLASGMREAYVHGAPARLAVTRGLRSGRPVVIAAGLIMVAVFGGFVFAESTMIRSIGFGLAFGVLADAFLVRLLLMPALMHLLGNSAWWLPAWLDRILPNVDVEGAGLERRHHPDAGYVEARTDAAAAEAVGRHG